MYSKIFITLSFCLVCSVSIALVKDEHRECKSSDDCSLVAISGCCGADTPVNKKYSVLYKKEHDPKCNSQKHHCENLSSICENKKCTTKILTNKESCISGSNISWCEAFQEQAERAGKKNEAAKWKKIKCSFSEASNYYSDCGK